MAEAPDEATVARSGWAGLLHVAGCLVLALTAVAGIAARFLASDRAVYEVWADRDLSRAAEFWTHPRWTGAEFDVGGSTPGGFYYALLATEMLVVRHPIALHRVTLALDAAALVFLALRVRRPLGTAGALGTAAFLAASPAALELTRTLAYNPTNAFPFGVVAYALLVDVLVGEKARRLVPAFLAIGLAAQIHFSYALLIPLFAIAVLASRRPVSRGIWAASALAFLATYVPYLIADALAGGVELQEILRRQHVVADSAVVLLAQGRGVVTPIRSGLENLARVLFGFVKPSGGTVGLLQEPWRLAPAIAMVGFLAIGALRWRRQDPGSRPATARLGALMALVLLLGVLLLSLRNTSYVPRYLMFLLPACALVFASATQSFANAVGRRPSWLTTVLAAVLLAGLARFGYANTVQWSRSVSRPTLTVERWRTLITDLQTELGFDQADLDSRLTVLDQATGRWHTLAPTHAASAYLARTFATPKGGGEGWCALVLAPPEGYPVVEADIPTAWSVLPQEDQPLRTRRIPMNAGLVGFAYRLPQGNCFRGVNSRYVSTPEERLVEAAPPGLVVEIPGAGDRRFVVTLRSRNPRRRELRMLVALRTAEGRVAATVYSNHLRGYDGLASFWVLRPAVVLHDGASEIRIPIRDGVLGGWFQPALAPWRSPAVPVPSGIHRAELVLENVAFEEPSRGEGTRVVRLTDRLEVGP